MTSLQRITAVALSVACTVSASTSNIDTTMINFQSGIDLGSTFAGGMTYDEQNNRLFLTGGTYARGFFQPEARSLSLDGDINSDCFFVAIQLASESEEDSVAEWKQPTRLGYVKDPEACSTVHYMEGHDRVFLGASASGASIGKTDIEGDILPRSSDVSLFGEVISLSLDHVYGRAPVIPQHYIFGGYGFYQSEVNYPFAITSAHSSYTTEDSKNPGDEPIYVASLYSKYTGQWAEDYEVQEIDLSSPYIEGNVWGISIQKISVNPSNATDTASILENPTHMQREWTKNYETTDFAKLQATDMVFVNGNLLLVGSTYDFGTQFAGEERPYPNYQDYDGFLIKIDPATGEIAQSEDVEEKMKLRILSGVEMDDIIHGICLHPKDEEGYVPYVYVVGSVEVHEGEGSHVGGDEDEDHEVGYGFVKQIDLRTMAVLWEKEVHGENIHAIDCAVTADGETLYAVGIAEHGGALTEWESNGGDDIWVRQFEAMNGEARWQIQAGSEEDETLAKGGAIVIDHNNNAIIYGNTRGSIGRVRAENLEMPDDTNDIFVMTVSFDGGYLAPSELLIFQIPRFYFGESTTQHIPLIVGMFLVALVLFLVVVGAQGKWKRVPVKEILSDVWPIFPHKKQSSGEDAALTAVKKGSNGNKNRADLTEEESSEEEEDETMAWLYSNHDHVPSTKRSEKGFEEEKTEMV